jgi:hypothetical protein
MKEQTKKRGEVEMHCHCESDMGLEFLERTTTKERNNIYEC